MKSKPSFTAEGISAVESGLSLTPPGSPPPTSTSITNLTDVELDASHVGGGAAAATAEVSARTSLHDGNSVAKERNTQPEDDDVHETETHSPLTLPGGFQVDESQALGRLIKKLYLASNKCYDGLETVGGMVAYMLGITESRYQWVLDTLTDEDIIAAKEDYIASRNERVMLFDEIRQRELERREAEEAGSTVTVAGSTVTVRGVDASVSDIEANGTQVA